MDLFSLKTNDILLQWYKENWNLERINLAANSYLGNIPQKTARFQMFVTGFLQASVPGVSRMTEVTIREQMTRMTSRAIAIPFQFLCGGLLPTSSCNSHRRENPVSATVRTGQRQKPPQTSDCRELLPSPASSCSPAPLPAAPQGLLCSSSCKGETVSTRNLTWCHV